jgi:hypothetical protein
VVTNRAEIQGNPPPWHRKTRWDANLAHLQEAFSQPTVALR